MTTRERLAAAVYAYRSNGCLVPFSEQGGSTKQFCYAIVDVVLDELVRAAEPYPVGDMAMQVAGGNALRELARASNYDLAALYVFRSIIKAVKQGDSDGSSAVQGRG